LSDPTTEAAARRTAPGQAPTGQAPTGSGARSAGPPSAGPRLGALLDAVRGRLVRQVWLHGLGTAVAAAAAWLGFAYTADRWLHLPAAIRLFHGLVFVGLPLGLVATQLVRVLRRIPDREGVALMLERRVPGTEARLVSALQLAPLASDPVRGSLVRRVQREAEDLADRVDPSVMFDARGPRRRFGLGVAVAGTVAGLFSLERAESAIFFQRMLGRDVAWPRSTTLVVEIARTAEGVQVEEVPGELRVRLARGSDLEVVVRAEGVVPDSIELEFEGGLREDVPGGGRATFRTLLRSLQADTAFRVTGGDDRRGVPRVSVTVLQPPDVAAVAFAVDPPAYSGLPRRVVTTPEVEVLAGSRVGVHVEPDPANARGIARTFPDAREIPLLALAWPASEAAGGAAPAAPRAALGFELVATESSRFRFELVDDTGLGNPDPGLFGVVVQPDRRPELTLLSPGQATVEVVAGGIVPVRLRIGDDYGIARAGYLVRDARDEGEAILTGELALRAVAGALPLPNGGPREVVGRVRLEVDTLGLGQPLSLGQAFMLTLVAVDGREPVANEARTAPIALRVVSADDLLRGVREGLSRVGESADKLVRLADGLGRSLGEAEAGFSGEELAAELASVVALATDARRAEGDARAVARDLSELAARLLYARIDGRATPLMERLDALLDTSDERGFQGGPWRTLADEHRAGTLGQADLGGELVTLVGLALDVAEPHAAGLAVVLQAAREAADPTAARAVLIDARARQRGLAEAAERLRARLGEWDDFQSILGLTKDLLGRQRNLEQRTRERSGKN
jgi:hypothetical protein